MGFNNSVKTKALVSSARHCCICHKQAGKKIEVHHIKPRYDGGEDTFENAIPVCFDCHEEIGSYNPKHPKGNKFSTEELIAQRDAWYVTVAKGSLDYLDEELIDINYYLLNDLNTLNELMENQFEKLPVENGLFYNNQISKFWRDMFYGKDYVHSHQYGKDISVEEYTAKYLPKGKELFHGDCFVYIGAPVAEEITNENPVVNYLIEREWKPEMLSKKFIYESPCCGHIYEYFEFRSFSFMFLCITNESNKNIRLSKLNASMISELSSHSSDLDVNEAVTIEMPNYTLKKGQSVFVPLYMLLNPFKLDDTKLKEISYEYFGERSQSISKYEEDLNLDSHVFIGPAYKPESLELNVEGHRNMHEVYNVSPANMFVINSGWCCGSCPHMYFTDGASTKYIGEIFTNDPGVEQAIEIVVEDKGTYIIAELEDEITRISSIYVNNQLILRNHYLNRNEFYSFECNCGDVVKIEGTYELLVADNTSLVNPMVKYYAVKVFEASI